MSEGGEKSTREHMMETVVDDLPRKKIGCLAPMEIVDNSAYDFYQIAPNRVMLVVVPLGISKFDREDVERIFTSIDSQLEQLKLRNVDLIVQSGVPLLLLIGVEGHDRRIDYIEKKSGIPATSSILGAVSAAKHLGIGKIAIADKFPDKLNDTLQQFFVREDIAVAGISAWAESRIEMNLDRVKAMSAVENAQLGYDLGRQAFESYPDAEGLYMPGGSWSLRSVVLRLEDEFQKPVIAHHDVMAWDVLHRVGCWEPVPGAGRLLSGD